MPKKSKEQKDKEDEYLFDEEDDEDETKWDDEEEEGFD